ncbi:emopamil-binding protein [Plakobranchus ocellatus]|uniref:Emopamil-binding protein n=1 Tax=Plakobranchus ocellatus TaxID=259542 RepID=A0AAV3YLZ0_9GAST|nr:emopamil-binding protein [Plakobranchus ocellatus]
MAHAQDKAVPSSNGKHFPTKCSKAGEGVFLSRHQQLPRWILIWFLLTAVICTWDASFIVFRPHSLPGRSMAWLWFAYKYYITVDQRYLDTSDAYVYAQSLLNYAEALINIVTIIMHFYQSRHTVATAFMVSVMTMWKTVLYFLMFTDLCTGSQYRQGNTLLEEIFLMVIPNFVWIVVPSAVMVVLWGYLVPNTDPLRRDFVSDSWAKIVDGQEGEITFAQWFRQRQVIRGPGSGNDVGGVKTGLEEVSGDSLQDEKPAKRLSLSLTSNVKQRNGFKADSDRK